MARRNEAGVPAPPLKDLADQTRRGSRGRVELGKSGGGLCYGYKVTRPLQPGDMTTGDREIVTTEAEVIRRIFRDYAAGVSPRALAQRLNRIPAQGQMASPGIRARFTAIQRAARES